jgi:glucose-6-phosphate 1-dehydrogenase
MREEVTGEDRARILRNKDLEEAWKFFRKIINRTIQGNVPRYENRRKRRPDWITQEMVREIRKKKRL